MSARLLIDAGNSRLKWAIARERRWQAQGDLAYTELARLGDVASQVDSAVVASVTSKEHENALRVLLRATGLPARWLVAEASHGRLRNAYADPAQLGTDRWMAAIAGHARVPGALLIVSVGTAMTVDAVSGSGVSDGAVFMGGLIVPGPALMLRALEQGTARIGRSAGRWQAFPAATADAVHSGMVAALAGAVRMQHERLAALSGAAPRCLLTGGNADLLQPHLPFATERVPALVLEGIDLVSREDAST